MYSCVNPSEAAAIAFVELAKKYDAYLYIDDAMV